MAKGIKFTPAQRRTFAAYAHIHGDVATVKHFKISRSALWRAKQEPKQEPKQWPKAYVEHFGSKSMPRATNPALGAIVLLRKAMRIIDEEHKAGRTMTAADAHVKIALETLEGR
jgi:hypothetical protein